MSTVYESYRRPADLGTPPSESTEQITLAIDGVDVTVPVGTTVLRAAALAGTNIPKLCATDSLEPFGSCRLCLVEIEGMKGLPASCTTEARAGMKVTTQNKRVADVRRNVMELYISDHPLDCLTCAVNGDCELQDMAGAVGLREVRYGYAGENHLDAKKDESNPYFTFDPSKCIVCSRCVRACEEVQGTFALTIQGRGFESKVSASQNQPFLDSECVSCGACVQACPTATLTETSLIAKGMPEHSVVTTCAYCGVGCSFRAEMKGQEVVRMVPNKDGHANHGHSCVKGRFAFGYATHKDRIKKPMIRETIHEQWREVSWDEAFTFTANKIKGIQAKYGKDSVGGITSSRCSNEETYLVQKLVRAAFGNNNVDTCARVCHSPTGFGLKATLGESAGTQAFDSVMKSDVDARDRREPDRRAPRVRVADEAPPARRREAHRRRPAPDRPRAHAAHRSVVLLAAAPRHERRDHQRDGAYDRVRGAREDQVHRGALRRRGVQGLARVHPRSAELARARGRRDGRRSARPSAVPRACSRRCRTRRSTTVSASPSTARVRPPSIAIANLAMCTGNIGREGVGVNPLRGQNNVQGSCDMGSFPHELPGYRHVSDPAVRALFGKEWGVELQPHPGMRIPNMFDAAVAGQFKALYVQGEDVAQSDPDTHHVTNALSSLECMIVQDLFLNETAKFAHVFLPGSSFLEKNGTFTNAERRISPVRKVMEPLAGLEDWEVTQRLANALGYPMNYSHPSEIMDEIARLTPTFTGVSYEKLDKLGSIQWPCNDKAENGTPTMHIGEFVRGKGLFKVTPYVPTDEVTTRMYPLLLTTGRILSQYNVGAQTRRTENVQWHDEDVLEIHPHDAEQRGIEDGDWVGLAAARARPCCALYSASACSPASSTRRSTIRSRARTWSRPTTRTGRRTAPSTRSRPCRRTRSQKLSEWQQKFEKFTEEQLDHLNRARSPETVG